MADNYSLKYIFEAVDLMSNNLKDMERNLKNFEKGIKGASKKVFNFEKTMKKAASGLRSFASQTRMMSLAATAALTGSAYTFSKFEKGIINVHGLLDDNQISKYNDELKALSKGAIAAGFSIADSNDALFFAVSALGLSEASLKAFNSAQVLAKGGNADLKASVLGITKIMNVYGRELDNSREIANSLFTAQKVGSTTVQELAMNVGKVTGMAKMAGMGFKEMLATFSVLTNSLASTEEAAVGMNAVIKGVVNPGKQAGLILNALGVKTGATAITSKGFANVLKQLRGAMIKNKDAVALAIPNIRALKGVNTLTNESLKLMDDTVKMINKDLKEGTGLIKSYTRVQGSLDDNIKRLKGSLLLISIEIGEILSPYIKQLSIHIVNLSRWFKNLDLRTKKTMVVMIALVAVVAPLATALAVLAGAAAFVGSSFAVAVGTIAAVTVVISGAFVYFDKYIWYINKMIDRVTFLINAIPGLGILFKVMDVGAKVIGEGLVDNPEIIKPRVHKMNKDAISGNADININLNAPKGVVKNYSSVNEGLGFNLGLNMSSAR